MSGQHGQHGMIPFYLYPHKLPNIGDIVIAQVKLIEDAQAYLQLLEYGNIEGMLPISELDQKRVPNIRRVLKIGRQEFVQVTNIDPAKGYIDLSKKHINQDDINNCKTRYLAAKRTIGFLQRWSERVSQQLTEIALVHYRNDTFDVYHDLINNNNWLNNINANVQTIQQIWEDYQRLYAVKPQKFEQTFELISYDMNGAELISTAITTALNDHSTDAIPLTCVYTGKTGKTGGVYTISTVTNDPNAHTVISAAVSKIHEALANTKYSFAITTASAE